MKLYLHIRVWPKKINDLFLRHRRISKIIAASNFFIVIFPDFSYLIIVGFLCYGIHVNKRSEQMLVSVSEKRYFIWNIYPVTNLGGYLGLIQVNVIVITRFVVGNFARISSEREVEVALYSEFTIVKLNPKCNKIIII